MKYALALIALAVAGCSDPANSKLTAGQVVVLVPVSSEYTQLMVDLPDGTTTGVTGGTRATVIADNGSEPARHVRLRISEGPKADLVCTLSRQFLRPAP